MFKIVRPPTLTVFDVFMMSMARNGVMHRKFEKILQKLGDDSYVHVKYNLYCFMTRATKKKHSTQKLKKPTNKKPESPTPTRTTAVDN